MMRPACRLWLFLSVAAALCLGLASGSSAASINYGDFDDIPPGIVTYIDVTESSGTDPVPLFDAPSISVNTLDFDPKGFVATSTGGPLDVTDGQLNFGFQTTSGQGLTSLFLSEFGDYSFGGFGGVETTVSASLSVVVEITHIDDVKLDTAIRVFASNTFSTDMQTAGGATGLLPWELDLLVDFTSVIPPGSRVTAGEVVIGNQLLTDSQRDSLAFIAKRDFKILAVPEPAVAVLFALGLGLAGMARRGARS